MNQSLEDPNTMDREWERIIDIIELARKGRVYEEYGFDYNLQNRWDEVFSAERNYNVAWSKSNFGYTMMCCICRKLNDKWMATYDITTNSPILSRNVLVKSGGKACRSKEEAWKYITGRRKAYAYLMDELHPTIPKKYEELFTLHGKPLPGFLVEGRKLSIWDVAHADLPMPDPSITIQEMHEYGYTWDDMLPLQEDVAHRLFENEDVELYLLYQDDTMDLLDTIDEIADHAMQGGIFGINVHDWRRYMENHQQFITPDEYEDAIEQETIAELNEGIDEEEPFDHSICF